MIFVEQVSKQFGSKALFEDVSFHLRPGEKVGLVGENGTGKTTFFKVITGKTMPDKGRVTLSKGLRLGLLEQDMDGGSETVLERVVLGDPHFLKLKTEMERLESDQAFHERYGDLQHEFERLGGYEREARAKIILQGLGLNLSNGLNLLIGCRAVGECGVSFHVCCCRALISFYWMSRPTILICDQWSGWSRF